MQNLSRFFVAALVGMTLVSCGGGGDGITPPPSPVLTTLSVSFQSASLPVGQSASAAAAGLDQFGAAISTGPVSWSTGSAAIATVTASGVVIAVAVGQTQVIADAGGKQAQATVTVIPAAVASVIVVPANTTLGVGTTRQLTATTFDPLGVTLTGRVVTWASSDESKATVNATGLVTAVAAGLATITATSEGKSGTSQITVSDCNSSSALQLTVGQIHTLTAAQVASLCLGGGASASEYVLIPFNNTNVAAAEIAVQITGANTSAIQPGPLAMRDSRATATGLTRAAMLDRSFELRFRERERRDLSTPFASFRQLSKAQRLARVRPASEGLRSLSSSSITDLPANPVVGAIYQINGNLTGNGCTAPKQLRAAKAVAVLPRTIVLSDQTSPVGGWTDAEMEAFGQAFETNGYTLTVNNFGAATDIDGNGRVVILFTPSVNAFPALGLTAYRDLFPATAEGCPASNEGEMFYMPVPDPNSTINSFFTDKDFLARDNLSTLIHEFQHLINGGRRLYVNDAFDFETVWLNEGLSHIAEELYYYQASGNTPRQNIDLNRLRSSQAQLDAVNAGQVGNLVNLSYYLRSTETSAPFAAGDDSETRGSIWQLLRYAADRTAAFDQTEWFAITNSRESGQTNFNAVFGNIMTLSRDWVVAQFADDAGLPVAANYTHPSWNYRSVLPAVNINADVFPLVTRPLTGTPLSLTLSGGGAAYLRFRVDATVPAIINAGSSGQPAPAAIELILMRTQ